MAFLNEVSKGSTRFLKEVDVLLERMDWGSATIQAAHVQRFQKLYAQLQKLRSFVESLTRVVASAFSKSRSGKKGKYTSAIEMDVESMLKHLAAAINVCSPTFSDERFMSKTAENLEAACGGILSDWLCDMRNGFVFDDAIMWFLYYDMAYHLVRIGSPNHGVCGPSREYSKCISAYRGFKRAFIKQPVVTNMKHVLETKKAVEVAGKLFELSREDPQTPLDDPPDTPPKACWLDMNDTSDSESA
jgi:hypothetical protein